MSGGSFPSLWAIAVPAQVLRRAARASGSRARCRDAPGLAAARARLFPGQKLGLCFPLVSQRGVGTEPRLLRGSAAALYPLSPRGGPGRCPPSAAGRCPSESGGQGRGSCAGCRRLPRGTLGCPAG